MKELTKEEVSADIERSNIPYLNRWLQRGDSVVVYENVDLSSSQVGVKVYLSFGGIEAQITKASDIPADLNRMPALISQSWAYRLVGLYSGELLPLDGGLLPPEPKPEKPKKLYRIFVDGKEVLSQSANTKTAKRNMEYNYSNYVQGSKGWYGDIGSNHFAYGKSVELKSHTGKVLFSYFPPEHTKPK